MMQYATVHSGKLHATWPGTTPRLHRLTPVSILPEIPLMLSVEYGECDENI